MSCHLKFKLPGGRILPILMLGLLLPGMLSGARVLAQALPSGEAPPIVPSGPVISEIVVRGNAKVESDAIIALLKSRKGEPLKKESTTGDIRALYELGYFSDVRLYSKPMGSGVQLIVEVKEKPAITAIAILGNSEITEDTLKEKLETKIYTIVNEATITADVRMIEKQYAEKGYYLAKVTYTIDKKGPNDVALNFHIDEGGKVMVGSVEILGNRFFSTAEIINGAPGLASKPLTRSSAFSSASLYQEDFVKRDLEYIAYIYRDQGFAEVKVAKPFQFLDIDRDYVRLIFQVEEGLQYSVGSLDVSGDLLFTKPEMLDPMKLKVGELFRYSRFTKDIEMLTDKYGDLGYAYADVNPKTAFDRDKRLVAINYEITKGEKIYFGKMVIIGNTKTRDNVIRREFEVADSELYSGTRLTSTKANVTRLGFFEEVQIIKERDEQQQNLLNLNIKVKEKPTGQLQAAVGFTPNSATGSVGSQIFGQGRYDERNQSGRGWAVNFTGKWNGDRNYSLDTGFSDPRLNDSLWLAGINSFYSNQETKYLDESLVTERRIGASIFIGRRVYELLTLRATYRLQNISRDSGNTYILPRFVEQGVASSVIVSLLRNSVDNNIDPTSGTDFTLSQNVTGGPILRGFERYMESTADATAYLPVDFTDSYRTYFKIHGVISYIYPNGSAAVPFSERYRLGGFNDLRGWNYYDLGPRFNLLQAPGGFATSINKGGDKKLFVQFEYFLPLIPEAGIKSLIFTDFGRVYDDYEGISFSKLNRDVGFGFRWITPIAPFRFEWAYPIENGRLGDMKIIFYIGY